jgi:hypothetical protein
MMFLYASSQPVEISWGMEGRLLDDKTTLSIAWNKHRSTSNYCLKDYHATIPSPYC